MLCQVGGFCLRVRPLAFKLGPAQSPGGTFCVRVGSALSVSLACRCASVSSGGWDFAGACQLLCGSGYTLVFCSTVQGPRGGAVLGCRAGCSG